MKKWTTFVLLILLWVLALPGMVFGQFKPTDLTGCVLWISSQGDPYATTSINPGGAFLDTSNAQTCKDGDYIRQAKDLSSVADHMGVATAYRQPIYRKGNRHGPYIQFTPPYLEGDYDQNQVRARITNISAATGTGDLGATATNNSQGNTVYALDGGWMYMKTAAASTAFNWTAGAVSWTGGKTGTYTGVAEGMAYLNGSSRAISSAGGVTVFVVVQSKHTRTGGRATWFTHGTSGNLLFGCYPDGSNAPKLSAFVGGQLRQCTTLVPSHSPQIYSLRVDNTGCIFGKGDVTETVANATAVPTGSAVPRIGQYSPDTTSQWYGAGNYYQVIVYNRVLNSTEYGQVMTFLRAVTDIKEYNGFLSLNGYSIWAGENSPDCRFWELLDVERAGYELHVNANPGITQTAIRANMTATTGYDATTAIAIKQPNYLSTKKVCVLSALTNNFTPGSSPDHSGNPTAGFNDLVSTISTAQGMGFSQIILTTDVDKYTGTSQWRTDIDAATPLIRALGFPLIDFQANTRLGAAGAARNQQYFVAGYVHPNATGHALMAAEAEKVLMPILTGRKGGDRSGR